MTRAFWKVNEKHCFPHNQKIRRKIGSNGIYLGLSPCPVTVTTTIIIFLVGDPYKPSFATGILGGGTT